MVQAEPGETILEIAHRANIPLIGGCGGAGVCGSCYVEIAPEYLEKIPEPEFNEQDLLECLPVYKPTSRLACQIQVTESMDGMIVNII